jgi:hypothetical protein
VPTVKCKFEKGNGERNIQTTYVRRAVNSGRWTVFTQFGRRGCEVAFGNVVKSKPLISWWRRVFSLAGITTTNVKSEKLLEAWYNKRGYYYKLDDNHPSFSEFSQKVLKKPSYSEFSQKVWRNPRSLNSRNSQFAAQFRIYLSFLSSRLVLVLSVWIVWCIWRIIPK